MTKDAEIQEVLEILEKEEYEILGEYMKSQGVKDAIAKLRSIKAPESIAYNFAINCGAMGKGDDSCCGCIIWTADGKLLCNECGTEYHLVEVAPEQPPAGEFTKKCQETIIKFEEEGIEQPDECYVECNNLLVRTIEKLKAACDRLDTSVAARKDLLDACEIGLSYIQAIESGVPRPILDFQEDKEKVRAAIAKEKARTKK